MRTKLPEASRRKALVVEPRRWVQRVVKAALREMDFAVQSSASTAQARKQILTSAPDVVLLDVQMPQIDGRQLLQAIKERSPGIRVILLTAEAARPTDTGVAVTEGIVTDVPPTKAFDRDELVHRLNQLFARARGTRRPEVKAVSDVKGSSLRVDPLRAHWVPELHDPATGRLDAKRIAAYLEVPVAAIARGIAKSTQAVHKSPATSSLQDDLGAIVRVISILSRLYGTRGHVVSWLNSPHPDLGNRRPLAVILEGKALAVAEMLEAALAGQPS
jgi:DNA-binding response OmpR family regulator